MFRRKKIIARLLQGTVFTAAILFAPSALALDYNRDIHAGGDRRAYADTYRSRNHHTRRVASYWHDATTPHRGHRYMMAAYRPESASRAAPYEEDRYRRATMMWASYEHERSYAALAAKREELEAADERERPITAELNLVQLRAGRDRAAEIAHRQLRYGSVASAKAQLAGG